MNPFRAHCPGPLAHGVGCGKAVNINPTLQLLWPLETSRHGNVSAIRANPERFPHNPGCCAVEGSLHRSIGATATSFCSRYMTRGSDKARIDSVNRITTL